MGDFASKLADPKRKEGKQHKQCDHVVANPPFSDKRLSTELDAAKDRYSRFDGFGIPPAQQGDGEGAVLACRAASADRTAHPGSSRIS
jgi:type I restriction-modification system DNA methylase subunit